MKRRYRRRSHRHRCRFVRRHRRGGGKGRRAETGDGGIRSPGGDLAETHDLSRGHRQKRRDVRMAGRLLPPGVFLLYRADLRLYREGRPSVHALGTRRRRLFQQNESINEPKRQRGMRTLDR